MLKNSCYDTLKILYKLSKICWFIEKHAKQDAQGNAAELDRLQKLQDDIQKHISEFKKAIKEQN